MNFKFYIKDQSKKIIKIIIFMKLQINFIISLGILFVTGISNLSKNLLDSDDYRQETIYTFPFNI